MAQRLSRRLCNDCKRKKQLLGEDKRKMDLILTNIPRKEELPEFDGYVYEAVGCSKCGNTGYKGRLAIVEAILMDIEVEKVIRENPAEITIWKAARHQKIRRMYEDGAVKVLRGITSFEELKRVVDINEDEIIELGKNI